MIAKGRVVNGVVVFDEGAALPEGTVVSVVPEQAESCPGDENLMAEEEHRRVIAAMDRIAALPIEGSTEPFSGADHDKVLYGKP